jgi:CDP-diacylglycerol--glycerol-3-phosphate 3-phosphatidyltransferase
VSGPRASRLAWLPNAITALRLAAIPVILGLVLSADGPTSVAAGLLFTGVALTDFLDGMLARRLGAESAFGRVADPLADRLLVAAGLVGLLILGRLHWVAPVLVLLRDATAMAVFVAYARRGVMLRVDLPGKISSGLVMGATAFCLGFGGTWPVVLFWIATAASLASFAHYAAGLARRGRPGAALGPS